MNPTIQSTAAEAEEIARMSAALVDEGYQPCEWHNRLTAGARVRHVGQQYPEATINGTAMVIQVFHKPGSAWERSWGQPDVEVLILRDKELIPGSGRVAQWADYHCVVLAAPERPIAWLAAIQPTGDVHVDDH